jgi:hypothetical protein
MDIHSTYQGILEEISKGHRGLVNLSSQDNEQLELLLEQKQFLKEVLCILEHASRPNQKFEKYILNILCTEESPAIIVFALNCARKHIVEARLARGNRLEFDFLEALKTLLHHSEPEVVEWTLRLIEGCGNQGIYFLKEFDKIKPAPWKWFNSHQRAVREIITLLERRWSPIEKPRTGP